MDERACSIGPPGDVDHYRHLTACFTCPLKPKYTPDNFLHGLAHWLTMRTLAMPKAVEP
jgi:hypothetical protein